MNESIIKRCVCECDWLRPISKVFKILHTWRLRSLYFTKKITLGCLLMNLVLSDCLFRLTFQNFQDPKLPQKFNYFLGLVHLANQRLWRENHIKVTIWLELFFWGRQVCKTVLQWTYLKIWLGNQPSLTACVPCLPPPITNILTKTTGSYTRNYIYSKTSTI